MVRDDREQSRQGGREQGSRDPEEVRRPGNVCNWRIGPRGKGRSSRESGTSEVRKD